MAETSENQTRVRHVGLGEGTVVSWKRGGRVAIVDFDGGGLPSEVPRRELTLLPERPVGTAPKSGKQAPAPPAEVAAIAPVGAIGAETRDSGSAQAGEPEATAPRHEPSQPGTERSKQRPNKKQPKRTAPPAHSVPAREELAVLLEAMRLGVVPHGDISAYTVGREAELELVRADLERAETTGGASRAFLGDYGAGKTHLLELAEEVALREGFATARVVLSAEETPPSHPKRVYHELARSLRLPDASSREGEGLASLIRAAAESPAAHRAMVVDAAPSSAPDDDLLEDGFHLYLSPALGYVGATAQHGEESTVDVDLDLLLAWLGGHPTIANREIDRRLRSRYGNAGKIYSLKDYRPWSRIYGYVLSGLSSLARLAGHRGLVVLVDEAEFYALLSAENKEYALTLFQALSAASTPLGGESSLPFEMERLDELGGYGVQQRLPVRYGDAPGLYCVFAMTPNPEGMEVLERSVAGDRISEIRKLSRADYAELVRRVHGFYKQAYPENTLSDELVGPLSKIVTGLLEGGHVSNPRHAMKFLIEFLDISRHEPEAVRDVVAGLRRTLVG